MCDVLTFITQRTNRQVLEELNFCYKCSCSIVNIFQFETPETKKSNNQKNRKG